MDYRKLFQTIQGWVVRYMEPLRRQIRLMIVRGIVDLISAEDVNGMKVLQVKVLQDDLLEDVELYQDYGFASVPLQGGEAILLSVAGSRENSVAICSEDRRYRLQGMGEGEVALYTSEGDYIWFKSGNIVEVQTSGQLQVKVGESAGTFTEGSLEFDFSGTKTVIDSSGITTGGDIAASGDIKADGDVVADAAATNVTLKNHGHSTAFGPTISKIPSGEA